MSEYVRLKHKDIYAECKEFYKSVVDVYSQNQNLTKTVEFRQMVEKHDRNEDAEAATGRVIDETASEQASEPEAEAATGRVIDETASEQSSEPEAEAATGRVIDETLIIGSTYVEPGLILNNYIVRPPENILSEAMNQTIDDVIDDVIEPTQDMEAIVGEIIRDLEGVEPDFSESMNQTIDDGIDPTQDMEAIVDEIIRDLEDVEPDIFNSVEDEGIDLNVEDEIDDELYDFDIGVDNYNLW